MKSMNQKVNNLMKYGNPRVGARLRVARAIDRVNPKPKGG